MTAPRVLGAPPTLAEIREQGREALRAGEPRWRNPYRASADTWAQEWEAGWDDERVEVLVSRDGP